MPSIWTFAADAKLIKLWKDGTRVAEIAGALALDKNRVEHRIANLRTKGILAPRATQIAGRKRQPPPNEKQGGEKNWKGLQGTGWPKAGTLTMLPSWSFACKLWCQEQGIG